MGDAHYHSIRFDANACHGCMACMRVCPTNIIQPALLEAGLEVGRQEFSVSIQQFFWGEAKERNPSPSTSPPAGDGPHRDGWFGGTYLTCGVTLRP